MLVTPRIYQQSQGSGKELWSAIRENWDPANSWHELPKETVDHVRKMRLVHQAGSVKVGEVVRYTLTYTPSRDRIVPTPATLHVKVKNSSAIALRAAYLHGPYTLYTACYPSSFDPNTKHEKAELFGQPQFEPNLKAGGSWSAQLKVPEEIQETTLSKNGPKNDMPGGSVTWIIEVTSQVLFSSSAAVHYEILVGRDEKSTEFGFAGMGGSPNSVPGQLVDHQKAKKHKRHSLQWTGVYSEAISIVVDDTASLWSSPELPKAREDQEERHRLRTNPILEEQNPSGSNEGEPQGSPKQVHENDPKPGVKKQKRQRIHLVLITHGLHSNMGADMLYVKESIDATAKQARLDRQMRKAKQRAASQSDFDRKLREDPKAAEQLFEKDSDSEDEDEQVIVRGYPGNAVKTERGIMYLGKRLAKYILAMTYPDQPYLPVKKKTVAGSISSVFSGGSSDQSKASTGQYSHNRSTIHKEDVPETNLPYKITSISFIGHSLGGLTQMYAIAYIQKHSPEFFQLIKPINFVALATPFLGLSNENPLYVKFALDFGLVGRTGQDLGLTWRAPTMVRSGWGAMIAGMGNEAQRKQRQLNPGAKPLLRILPAGPAHHALQLFRNRTVYSNVVNDGIVPLRTSCLLFLDWRGLGRVEKARRENGVVGTMVGWGWAEITGMNSTDQRKHSRVRSDGGDSSADNSADERVNTPTQQGEGDTVPQPSEDAVQEDNQVEPSSPTAGNFANAGRPDLAEGNDGSKPNSPTEQMSNPFAGFLALLKPGTNSKSNQLPKHSRIYKRSQTTALSDGDESDQSPVKPDEGDLGRPGPVRGESILQEDQVIAPPSTSLFEAAGDLLNPPLPDTEYINNPQSRPRTIFHDRVYHPNDIPPPPSKPRQRSTSIDGSSSVKSSFSMESGSSAVSIDTSNMKVEEKIARAYHQDLSWRKVLVRLEPDAHNNIIVRRMFANAYGWPVIKHLVDTHFADTYAAETEDTEEGRIDRAKSPSQAPTESGEEVKGQQQRSVSVSHRRNRSEERDAVPTLPTGSEVGRHSSVRKPRISRQDSAQWDERFFASDDDDEDDELFTSPRSPKPNLSLGIPQDQKRASGGSSSGGQMDGSAPIVAPNIVASPSTTTSEIGLRKSLEEQFGRASVPSASQP